MQNVNTDTAQRSMHVVKTLNAPMELVWKVWTDPQHIPHWWGPEGFTTTIRIMDVAPGGEWRLTMHGPDGKDYPNRSNYLEVKQNEKIVFEHFNPDYIATIIFTPQDNQTELQWTVVFKTSELFETVVKVFKADEGLKQNVDKLERYLDQLQNL